jgi:RNA polymerase sigma-70 factor (ECF subfamily)
MEDSWTEIGEDAPSISPTRWSIILRARDTNGAERRESLEQLIRIYWRPLYAYLRKKWNKNNEDAKDLTQAFFADLLREPVLQGVEPEKGRFRTFLLVRLRNFMLNEKEAESALKRGGGEPLLPLETEGDWLNSSDNLTPEEIFDQEWERAIVHKAIRELREAYAQEKREVYFQVFKAYDLESDSQESYAALAVRLGIKETDVINYLSHARRRLRQLAAAIVRDSVESDSEVEPEILHLFRPE